MAFSLPIFLVIALFSRRDDHKVIPRGDYLKIFLLGLIGYYLASYLDFKGLEYIKASLERLILFVYPTLVIVIGALIFKDHVTRAQIVGVLVTYLGILIVFLPEIGDQNRGVITGALLVFLSALSYGSYLVGSGRLIPRWGAKRFTTMAMLISTGAVFVHFLVINKGLGKALEQEVAVYLYTLAMAVFSTVLPSYLISFSIKGLGAGQFAIFASMGPISTIVLAFYFLGERLTPLQLVGGIVVISGVFVAERFRQRAQ